MTVDDPGMDFWFRYVNAEGGAYERAGDSTLMLLPDTLQHRHDQPEDLLVTSDPDVAREDGAVLLSAGHPMLAAAAQTVLAQGDCGSVRLPRPVTRAPDTEHLLARARETFTIDHGRIDLTGGPRPGIRTVLRVSSLVTYALSADDHFQEQVECWVDVQERLALGDDAADELVGLLDIDHPERDHIEPDAERLLPALAEADREIHRRAAARRDLLAGQVSQAHRDEVDRASEYYRQIAESLARRRDTAAANKAAAYQARLESTAAERDRRLAEIDDKYRSTISVTPFRLQVIGVPALRLEVDVRRGDRRYPLELDWLLSLRSFAAVRCPGCRSVEPLVAGKAGLGCRRCQPRGLGGPRPDAPAAVSAPTASGAPTARGAPATGGAQSAAGARPAGEATSSGGGVGADVHTATGGSVVVGTPENAVGSVAAGTASNRTKGAGTNGSSVLVPTSAGSSGRPLDRAAAGEAGRGASPPPVARAKIVQVGSKLVPALWERVARGDRSVRRLFAPASPADALFRVCGPIGPRYAIGVSPTSHLDTVSTSVGRAVRGTDSWILDGMVNCTDRRTYRFQMCWHFDQGRPLIDEIGPFASAYWPRLPDSSYSRHTHGQVFQSPPVSITGAEVLRHDPVADVFVSRTVRLQGIPIALRCLAAWWRLEQSTDLLTAHRADVVAAGMDRIIRYRAGGRHQFAEVASDYGVDERELRETSSVLQRRLHLTATKPW